MKYNPYIIGLNLYFFEATYDSNIFVFLLFLIIKISMLFHLLIDTFLPGYY